MRKVILNLFEIIGFVSLAFVFIGSYSIQIVSGTKLSIFQDSEIAFLALLYSIVIIASIILFSASKYLQHLVIQKSRYLEICLRVVIYLVLFLAILVSIMSLLFGGMFKYSMCGSSFNNGYRNALKNTDLSFCLVDNNIQLLEATSGFKGGAYCYTPTGKFLELHYVSLIPNNYRRLVLEIEKAKASCISSMARDLNDVSVCDIIEDNVLPYSQGFYSISTPGDKSGCVYDFARYSKDVELCMTVGKYANSCQW